MQSSSFSELLSELFSNPSAQNFISLFQSLGTIQAYVAILGVLFVCGMGVPIPEDITLITAGILSAVGTISFEGAMIAGLIGVMVGDSLLFTVGKVYGTKVYTWPLFRRVFTPDRIKAAEDKIRRNSRFICFVARFMPGLRAPIYLTSGMMGVSFTTFFVFDGVAALISVPIWIYLGAWFGENIESALVFAKKMNIYLLLGLASVVAIYAIIRKRRSAKAA